MIEVKFFARLREQLGTDHVSVTWQQGMLVSDLLVDLKRRGPEWEEALSSLNLLVSVDQCHAQATTSLSDGVEVAFFPPVTGG